MKLLSRLHFQWRDVRHTTTGFSAAVLSCVLLVELLGRLFSTSDAYDWMAMVLLLLLGLIAHDRHKRQPLRWMQAILTLGNKLKGTLKLLTFKAGIDFRLKPPVPHDVPRALRRLLMALIALVVVLAASSLVWPHGLRVVAFGSYVLYVMLVAVVWLVLVGGAAFAILVQILLLRDLLILSRMRKTTAPKRTLGEQTTRTSIAMLGVTALAAIFLPVYVATAICALTLLVNLGNQWMYRHPQAMLVWRQHNSGDVRSMSLRTMIAIYFSMAGLIILALIVLSRGSAAFGFSNEQSWIAMPFTATLGTAFAWFAAATYAFVAGQRLAMFHIIRRHDPAIPCRPTVHAAGDFALQNRAELAAVLDAEGFDVRFDPEERRVTDVPIVLVAPPMPKPDESEHSRWPMKISLPALRAPELIEMMHRRDVVHKRRQLISGLQRLFKRATQTSYKKGTGFIVAPHIWFLFGLMRDDDDDETTRDDDTVWFSTIGPPYYRTFSREVRHHLWTMLHALEIDQIFVEDGVEFRRFKHVLRLLFEQYDIHGGAQRLEDRHFFGVPGTRVMIHEVTFDEPFKSDSYPEPEYKDLGRARILHVFKDRGMADELADVPLDLTTVPVPVGAY